RPGTPFFGRVGLGLQGGLDGLAREFLSGEDGGGLDAGEDLPVGGLGGGAFELLGEQERLFEAKGLQRRFGLERARWHGWFLQKVTDRRHAPRPYPLESITAPPCTVPETDGERGRSRTTEPRGGRSA